MREYINPLFFRRLGMTLMTPVSSLAAQKAAAARRQNRRSQAQEDQRSAANERLTAMKSKEAATMEMFKQMAQARFGGS